MTESRFADEDTLAHIAQLEAENARLREELAVVLEAQEKQDKTVTVRYELSSAAIEGAIRGKLIVLGLAPPGYEAQSEQEPFPFSAERVTYHKAAPVVQPGMVLVPREPTVAIREVIQRSAVVTFSRTRAIYDAILAAAIRARKP